MRLLTIKYKLVCLAVACCAIFTACEQADLATKSPMTFKNAQANPEAFLDSAANARLFAMTNNEFVYGAAEKGAYAQLSNFDFTENDHSATFKVKGDTKYWTTGTYNFFSAYSTRFNNTLDADNEPKFDVANSKFTFPYDITNQNEELWVAYLLNEESHISTNETVNLEFNPALAKINFVIKKHSANENDVIVVNSLSVSNIYTSGQYNLNVANGTTTWTPGTSTHTFVYGDDENETIGPIARGDGTRVVNNAKDGWLVIPQTLTTNIVLTINYIFKDETEPRTISAKLPTTIPAWQPGQRYVYNLILAPISNDILFTTPDVDNWRKSQTGGSIIIQ